LIFKKNGIAAREPCKGKVIRAYFQPRKWRLIVGKRRERAAEDSVVLKLAELRHGN
jgi:hypothetical protein